MKQVRITAQPAILNGKPNPNAGKIFTQSLKSDGTPKLDKDGNPYGYIRIVEEKIDLKFSYNGGVRTRSALKAMSLAGWEKAKHMYSENMLIDGQIVRKDSFEPFYAGQKNMQVPLRDASGKLTKELRDVTSGGKKVYRSEEYTDDQNAVDSVFVYDKVEVTTASAKAKDTTLVEGTK